MTCKTCYYAKPSNAPGRLNCRFNPPVVQFVPMELPSKAETSGLALPAAKGRAAQALERGPQIGFAPVSALPMVLETDFCHNYTDQVTTKS